VVADARRVVRPGGVWFTSTWNRLALAPEPHVRLWGVGWMPLSWRRRYVRRRKGVSYDHVRLLSAAQAVRLSRAAGFAKIRAALPTFSAAELSGIAGWQRALIGVYHTVKSWPVVRQILHLIAPVVHVVSVR